MLERFFGPTITSSTGRIVSVRLIGEQHMMEDLGFIPSFADWVRCIRPQPWMGRAQPIHKPVDPFAVTSGASTDHAPTAPLPLDATAAETPQRSWRQPSSNPTRARPCRAFACLETTMPTFTIESTYRIPIYRQRSYQANTLAEACRLAIEDDDWEGQKEDYESTGASYVTGAWPGDVSPYSVPALPVPSHFGEALQRKAEHFEVLLGLLKVFALPPDGGPADEPFWRQRAHTAIAKAEAILAGARDLDDEGSVS